MTDTQSIPYLHHKTGKSYNRLLVKSIPRPEIVADNGLIIPHDAGRICEEGIVFSVCPGSQFKVGDSVMYQMVERINKDEYESVMIDGEEYDAISENEVWSVNEKPHNRIHVKPISDLHVSEDALFIPDNVKGIPQKGIIMAVGFKSLYSVGDTIEYRKQEHGMYPTVCIDGDVMDVLFERDPFTVNGEAAPHRIIVKIDISEQKIKRETTEHGLALSPLFQFMLRNLQYGEVTGMGSEAKLRYPELEVGDTAILHHIVESQKYRLLKSENGNYDNTAFEYRLINISDDNSREIFGKIEQRRLFGRIHDVKITPFDNNVFLNWNFDTFESAPESNSLFIDMDFDLTSERDIDGFRNSVETKKRSSVEKYKFKYNSLVSDLQRLDPNNPDHKEKGDFLESQIEQLRREVEVKSKYIKSNHLLKCKIAFPMQVNSMVLVPYKELYPINLMGKKYLIAHKDYIMSGYMNNTVYPPYGDRVLVLPIEDESKGLLEIPDSAKEKPQKGKVIAVGSKVTEDIAPGYIVLYKRKAGTDISIDGVEHLMLFQNDLLCRVPLVAEDNRIYLA